MDYLTMYYSAIMIVGVFITSIAQVLLKKEALKAHKKFLNEYINSMVITAYLLLLGTTIISVYAYRWLPLSYGAILGSVSYVFVTFFGVTIFKEQLTVQRVFGLCLIIAGVVIYNY